MPAWAHVAMPSVADLIFVALLCVLVFTVLSLRLLGDAGIGWHIRTGQQILATDAIPRVDPFSSTMGGRPWFAWEWMYDVVVGQLEATLGLNGVVWFTAVVIAAVFAGTFRLLIAQGTNVLAALVLVLLAMSASTIHFLARPHVVSWLFTLVWFWILDSTERSGCDGGGGHRQRWLWTLPLLMLVWVNVHGGFLLGFVLLAIFWLGAVWDWFRARQSRIEELFQRITAAKRARDLAWVGLLSAAASLVNPYGWELHAHVYSYLSNRFLMDHIEEFQSPNFHGVAQRCFALLLLVVLAVLAVRGRQLRMSQGLTVLFAVYAGLYASRNIPVSAVLLAIVLGPLVSGAVEEFTLRVTLGWMRNPQTSPKTRETFLQRMTAIETGLRGHLWVWVAVLVTLGIAANGGRLGSSVLMNAHFDGRRFPVEAVNYLQKNGVKGPVLSPDYWGGYLIYRLYPEARVVVDDRHDFYGEEFLKSYLKMIHGQRGWEGFLHAHDDSCILLPRDAALTNILLESDGWNVIYNDDVATAFARSPAKSREPN